jgi:hypothetical protein
MRVRSAAPADDEEYHAHAGGNHYDDDRRSLLRPGNSVAGRSDDGRVVKAMFYAVQVFYSFFIM